MPVIVPNKTDKPRPHICATCTRSFARLEHLKRHERSHTKEKPFECSECTRCFARRDLLLRHQQKLHAATTPSSRPRVSRQESNAGSGRVRKNSAVNNTPHKSRPRANTLSHIDKNSSEVLGASSQLQRTLNVSHAHHHSDSTLSNALGDHASLFSKAIPPLSSTLPRLDTTALPPDQAGGLRTAPVYGGRPSPMAMFPPALGPSSTIDPNQLHMGGLQSFGTNDIGFGDMASASSQPLMPQPDHQLNWTPHEFDSLKTNLVGQNNDLAIDTSSPSIMDDESPVGVVDGMVDGSAFDGYHVPSSNQPPWDEPMTSQPQISPSPLTFDFGISGNQETTPISQVPPLAMTFDPRYLFLAQQPQPVSSLQG